MLRLREVPLAARPDVRSLPLGEFAWTALSGTAKVLSWTTFRCGYFPEYPPVHTVVALELAEGPLFISYPVDLEPASLHEGMTLELRWTGGADKLGGTTYRYIRPAIGRAPAVPWAHPDRETVITSDLPQCVPRRDRMISPFAQSLAQLLVTHASPEVPKVSVAVRADGAETPAAHGCTPATLFQAASISKPIAALAALALVRDGVLKLDDLVNTKLAGPWGLVSHNVARGAPTLRQLLNHTAGVNVRAYPGYPHGTTPPAIRDILIGGPAINTAPTLLVATAGAGEMYSGGGYTVLQCLLEDITKKSLPDLVQTLVFNPLRMTSARYSEPLLADAAPAIVHGNPVPGGWRRYPELAAAGLWCTPTDLVRFGSGIQDSVAGVTGAILPAKLATEMLTRSGDGFGLGLELAGTGTGRRFGHGGQNEGYLCELTATVGPGPVIVVMTASDRGNDVLHPLVPAIRKLANWPDTDAITPKGRVPDPPTASSDVEALSAMYSRTYETDSKVQLQLTGNCYNWTLAESGRAGVGFEALDATTLESLDRSQRIEFAVDAKLRPTKITITGPTGTVTAKPV